MRIVQHATLAGLTLHPKVRLHDLAAASLAKQTKKHKPLVPEYHQFSHQLKHLPIPEGARVLAPHGGGESEEELDAAEDHEKREHHNSLEEQSKLGHFHSPKQFVSVAKSVQHPMVSVEHLEEATLFSMRYNLQQSQDLIKLERKKNLL